MGVLFWSVFLSAGCGTDASEPAPEPEVCTATSAEDVCPPGTVATLDSVDELPPLGEFFPDSEVVEALERGLRVTPDDPEPEMADGEDGEGNDGSGGSLDAGST